MSNYTDWKQWKIDINNNVEAILEDEGLIEQTVSLQTKIVDILGEIIPGWLTVSLGFFDEFNKYYPRYTRDCSIKLSQDFTDIPNKLINESITDSEKDLLWNYLLNSLEVKAHSRE